MNQYIISQEYKDLLYIIRCSVRKEKLSENKYIIKTSLEKLYSLACLHSIEALLYETIKTISWNEKDNISIDKWRIAHDKAYRKYIMFSTERQSILKEFNNHSIWHLPLKGVILQEYYTKPFYRQMSDNDIIFDENRRKDVKHIMLDKGYSIQQFNSYYDDIYHKEPFYNFEMHVKLSVDEEFEDYFKDLNKRLIKSSSYSRKMTDKDFYIYLLLHELKHYNFSGVGLRYLVDLQFYLKANEEKLNWIDINNDLKNLKIFNFEKKRRYLIDNLFSDDFTKFNDIINDEILAYYCQSGTHGNLNIFVDNRIQHLGNQKNILFFYFTKLSKSLKYSLMNKKLLQKYKILIPFYMVYKTVKSFFNKNNWKELILVIKKLRKK